MKLYLRYLMIHLKSQMQYKTSFLLTALGQFLSSFAGLLSISFMFSRFHAVQDFSFPEVLLCFAVVLMAFSLAECFARGFDTFSTMIGDGQFDRIMVRPRGAVFQVLAQKVELTRVGRLIQAILVFCYAIPESGVQWTADKILLLALMILSGTMIFSGLFVIYASLCFFTTEGLEFMNIFTDGGLEFGRYPFSIYGKRVLKFFTYVVPLALVQYYPMRYLIGRSDSMWCFLLPVAALLFLLPCYGLWRLGVCHYKSTGS
jgi:ABC-2 type transport system permease protein